MSACQFPRLIRPSTTRVCSITMSQVPELCQRKPKASDEGTKFAAQALDMYVFVCVCMHVFICLSLYTCLREPWCFMSKCEAATVSPCTKTVSERSATSHAKLKRHPVHKTLACTGLLHTTQHKDVAGTSPPPPRIKLTELVRADDRCHRTSVTPVSTGVLLASTCHLLARVL